MDLQRLKELAGIATDGDDAILTEDEYGRDQGARAERQGSEFQKTENKALKKKAKELFAKTAGMDDKAIEIVAKKLGVTFDHAKQLLDESLMEAKQDVKNWTAKDFTKALHNEGMTDNPNFGDIKFVQMMNTKAHYFAVVEDDNEGHWMVTSIFAWHKDGEPRADWSGSPVLDGFSRRQYANEAMDYIIKNCK